MSEKSGDWKMRPVIMSYALMFAALVAAAAPAGASDDSAAKETPPTFSKSYLDDSKHQKAGEEIWADQCRHCHGASAYPGKAPKLKPWRYKADFVFDRITNGFLKMPAWKDVYTKEERMALVAYILSDDFSP